MSRPDSDLASLRKLARQLGAERKEAPSTVHLLAAVHRAGGPARGLLEERRIDEARLLGTVRAFDEQVSDAISHALADARKVAELVATTDGIIFHLWPHGDAFPTGTVVIDQAVGHKPLTAQEYRQSAAPRRTGND